MLGAGGVMGGAWHTGALSAMATTLGWDPGSADTVVGTSAGAVIGSLCAAGVPPWFMVAHSAGEVFDGLVDRAGRPASEADRSAGAVFRVRRGLPILALGSPRLAVAPLLRRGQVPWLAALAGLGPVGMVSTEPIRSTVRRAVPSGWGQHQGLWVCTTDYSTGDRVVFGRTGSPPADLADAVAASAAIPGFFAPVRIGRRRYVDGGAWSFTNADLLLGGGYDLVIILSPASSPTRVPGRSPLHLLDRAVRHRGAGQVRGEADRLRAEGASVVVLEPTPEVLAIMGPNPMARRQRHRVIEAAERSVAAQLVEAMVAAPLLHCLPVGDPFRIRRPAGPPSSWPGLSSPRTLPPVERTG